MFTSVFYYFCCSSLCLSVSQLKPTQLYSSGVDVKGGSVFTDQGQKDHESAQLGEVYPNGGCHAGPALCVSISLD